MKWLPFDQKSSCIQEDLKGYGQSLELIDATGVYFGPAAAVLCILIADWSKYNFILQFHPHFHFHNLPSLCFSPLKRSKRTAEIIWGVREDEMITDYDLREIDLYSFQVFPSALHILVRKLGVHVDEYTFSKKDALCNCLNWCC